MSIHPFGTDVWTKMPTEKLQSALALEPEDSENFKAIKTILDARNTAQIAKAMLAVSESNRAMAEELQKITAQNEATSQRLGRITITVSILATVAVISALIAILRK